MPYLLIAIFLFGLGLVTVETSAKNPYLEPLKPQSFKANALVVPSRQLGAEVLRKGGALGVEVQVNVEDFLPRALEPTLVIDGVPVEGPYRIVSVQDPVTTLGFLVEKPELLKEGASLSIRMGDDKRTEAKVPGALYRKNIQPLEEEKAKQMNMPSLEEWLTRASPASGKEE